MTAPTVRYSPQARPRGRSAGAALDREGPGVDLASQAELAVRLVNTAADPAPDRELFTELATDQPFATGPLTAQDMHWLAMLRSELAEVFAAAARSEAAAVDPLNMLLAAHPLRPV